MHYGFIHERITLEILPLYFRDQLIHAYPLPLNGPESQDIDAPALPAEFLRGTPINTQPQPRGRPGPESISGPVLILNENGSKGGTREPVNIPLPDLITSDNNQGLQNQVWYKSPLL